MDDPIPGIPPDFGGIVGAWAHEALTEGNTAHRLFLLRYGKGEVQDGLRLTPLNALQLRGLLDGLIKEGIEEGWIALEHIQMSATLLPQRGVEKIIPRSEVDDIAGSN